MLTGKLLPALFGLFMQQMRLRPLRRLPIAFGWLTRRGDAATARWMKPVIQQPEIRRDAVRAFVRSRGGAAPHAGRGPGVRQIDALAALAPQGFAMVGGSCRTVAAGGLLQGGGYGPLTRGAGMACDRLVSARVVLADGAPPRTYAAGGIRPVSRPCRVQGDLHARVAGSHEQRGALAQLTRVSVLASVQLTDRRVEVTGERGHQVGLEGAGGDDHAGGGHQQR